MIKNVINNYQNDDNMFSDYKSLIEKRMVQILMDNGESGSQARNIMFWHKDDLLVFYQLGCDPDIVAKALTFWYRRITDIDEYKEQVSHYLKMYYHYQNEQLKYAMEVNEEGFQNSLKRGLTVKCVALMIDEAL